MDDKKKSFKKKPRQLDQFAGAGKVQPQATNLEEAVLGALMLDKDAVALIIDILRPASFYREAHQHVYKAICNLFEKSHPIDLLTVTEELKTIGKLDIVGGPYQLVELTNRVASSANIEFHARIIAQKFIQRELIRTSTETIKNAYEDTIDVFDLLDSAEQNLFNITEQNLSRGSLGMSTLVNMAVKQLEEMAGKEEGLTGVPTGFVNLDQLTSGWQPSDLIIIAARPGMGKCLAKGTKVLLYDGRLREVERIQKGDQLMGDDSTPRQVLSIARGQEQMYWIHQDQAMSYRVNASHILSLRCIKATGDYQKDTLLHISVKEWLTYPTTFQACFQGYKVAVDFPKKPTLLPTYWVGLHLAPLLSEWQTVPEHSGGNRVHLEGKTNFSEPHQLSQLRNYSLQQKRLPRAYLWGTQAERLELLAGWVDVLGRYWASEQRLIITLNNAPLAKQLKFVADSLGFWTNLQQEEGAFQLRIGGDLRRIPSRRHDLEVPSFRKVVANCSAIQVEKDQVDDYYGFTLDENNLFLLEDMTVTHNTSFTMAVARNAAIDFNKGVAFFSLEMSSLQLVNRLISMETEIPSEKLRKGQLEEYEWQQLHAQVDKLSNVPLFIDDTPGISIFELRAKCRRLKMQHDIQMIIIDYLQLMTGGGDNKGNREQEISMISRGLKGLAKELSVPVIALSQLSRAVETRGGDKRPQLSDLRESGAIEQDADIVSFIYRPEYYQILEDEEGNSLKGVGEIIVAKHRNGALDSIKLKWDGQYAKFSNLDDDAFTGLDDASFFDQAPSQLSGETFSSKMNDANENKGTDDIDDVPF
ncbi:MAG: replicative DNA helicase [Aureispira sp.]